MKKIYMLFFAIVYTTAIFAQTGHMTFMGIPLNGTISSFQTKLAAKGIKPQVELNPSLRAGCRAFSGYFAGHEADIYVYYDISTKIVYRAKACVNETIETVFEQRYQEFKSLVESKYNGYKEESTQDSHECVYIFTQLGTVSIYTSKHTNVYPTRYVVHIDYEDDINTTRNKKSQLDDI
jgi:hypothetical protein